MDLDAYMDELRVDIDAYLISYLKRTQKENPLFDVMHYSVANGGKRLRPLLLLMTLECLDMPRSKGLSVAAALEMVHTYSLIHDDLPAMDDDDMRRGKPTNHKVYGEAMAILAGDGLLTDAFRLVVEDENLEIQTRMELALFLSSSAGSTGMIAGQVMDMEAEENPVTLETLKNIHLLKTGRLIEFAVVAAGLIAKQSNEVMVNLSEFAKHLGLAFQIQDDILDVEGDARATGKTVGSDRSRGKSTYVSLLGLEGAKRILKEEINQALNLLDDLPADAEMLKKLTLYVASRDR